MPQPGRKFVSLSLLIASIGFAVNFAWEMLQMPLYANSLSFWQHVPICAVASLGDVVILFLMYGIIGGIKKSLFWIYNISKQDLLLLIPLGIVFAILIEMYALHHNWWQYDAMPIIPIINVGLLPLLQMVILPFFIFYLSKIISNKLYEPQS